MFPDLTCDDVFRIETRRLWLRWPSARDAGAIVRLAGAREVAEMTARIPHPIDPIGIDSFIIGARRHNSEGRALTMALSPRSAPASLIGIVGIEPDARTGAPQLGYWLGRPHWSAGLMSEAAAAMVDAFFAYAGGTTLQSDCMIENRASRRVLEKLGFVHQGTGLRAFPARDGDRQVDLFELTRAEWAKRQADADPRRDPRRDP